MEALYEGLDIAGQNDFTRPAALLRRDERDGWNRLAVGPLFELLLVMPAPGYSGVRGGDGAHGEKQDRTPSLDRRVFLELGLGAISACLEASV